MVKILIGTPISKGKLYCWDEYIKGVTATGCDIAIVVTDKDKAMVPFVGVAKNNYEQKGGRMFFTDIWTEKVMDRIVVARNMLRKRALQGGYDYLLFVDADVIIAEGLPYGLARHNLPVTAAVYHILAEDNTERVPHNLETVTEYKQFTTDLERSGLHRASQVGFGCTLIRRDVLEKVPITCVRDDKGKLKFGEDYSFSNDCYIKHNIPLWIDSDIIVPHRLDPEFKWDMEKA